MQSFNATPYVFSAVGYDGEIAALCEDTASDSGKDHLGVIQYREMTDWEPIDGYRGHLNFNL
jgi:hypothetical protein